MLAWRGLRVRCSVGWGCLPITTWAASGAQPLSLVPCLGLNPCVFLLLSLLLLQDEEDPEDEEVGGSCSSGDSTSHAFVLEVRNLVALRVRTHALRCALLPQIDDDEDDEEAAPHKRKRDSDEGEGVGGRVEQVQPGLQALPGPKAPPASWFSTRTGLIADYEDEEEDDEEEED